MNAVDLTSVIQPSEQDYPALSAFTYSRNLMPIREQIMRGHRVALANCSRCPSMTGPVVSGSPVLSPILLIGQAPGDKEGGFGKPFAWTAGKTMFKWFERIGIDEQSFRQRVYMAAVCHCFPDSCMQRLAAISFRHGDFLIFI